MKTASTDLKTQMAAGTNTLAWCWKVVRQDSQVFGFTNIDKDLVIDGVTYEAAGGITPNAIESRLDGSVPNLEVAGLLDSDRITEDDLLAGLWDGATVVIFEVNHRDLSQGIMVMRTGTLGEVSAGATMFRAEHRGLAQQLQQAVGETYAAACSANLGDARCKIDLTPFTMTGAVTAVTSNRLITDSGRGEADDYYGGGVITFTSGANSGRSMEIALFTTGGVIGLHLPMPHNIHVGDTYSIVPGCRKRRVEDCSAKFSNVINFRGFPDVPGNDKIIGTATAADGGE